jgi:hypothetical protein
MLDDSANSKNHGERRPAKRPSDSVAAMALRRDQDILERNSKRDLRVGKTDAFPRFTPAISTIQAASLESIESVPGSARTSPKASTRPGEESIMLAGSALAG